MSDGGMRAANGWLRYVGAAAALLFAVGMLLYPRWRIELAGGRVLHPRSWFWRPPDLSLVDETWCGVDVMSTGSVVCGALLAGALWWWLGGVRRRGVTPSP